MDRRQLEYFLAVADARSFSKAAVLLSLSQPSLSHAIAAMERELGAELFERQPRGVRLTAAGAALVQPAKRALRSFHAAQLAVRSVAEAGYGRLAIVCHTLWAIEPLTSIIGEFRQLHPRVQFVVSDPVRRSDALDRVRSGEANFALLDGTPPGAPFETQWLIDHELVAVLPPRTPWLTAVVELADLTRFGLICTPEGTDLRAMLDKELVAVGAATEVAVQTAHMATLVPLVLAGAGAAVLPAGMAGEAASKGARVLPLGTPTRASVHLVWRCGRLAPLDAHFLSVAVDTCRQGIGEP